MTEPSEPASDLDPQGIWQAQQKELDPVTLAQVYTKAAAFEKLIHRRNAVQFMTFGIAIVMASVVALFFPNQTAVMRAGDAGIVLGLAFMAWQLHRRTAPEATPRVGESLVDAYRRQLIRQRDAGIGGFWWYVFPIIPGTALMLFGVWLKGPAPGAVARLYISIGVVTLLMILGLGWSLYLIRAGVRGLQKMIDEL